MGLEYVIAEQAEIDTEILNTYWDSAAMSDALNSPCAGRRGYDTSCDTGARTQLWIVIRTMVDWRTLYGIDHPSSDLSIRRV
jgi:hypothetical protein